MKRRQFLSIAGIALVWPAAHAQQPTSNTIKAGQRVAASFLPAGSRDALLGEFAVTEVKGPEIAGKFSGHLCGPNVYDFTGRLEGELLEAKSTSKWGPITVSARRVSGNRFSGSFAGRIPGKVELEILD
jgi:hypothetical protein